MILHWKIYSLETIRGGDFNSNYLCLILQNWPLSPDELLEKGQNTSRRLRSIICHIVIESLLILTLIRTVFLRNLIGTFVDICQHAVFMCFSMLMRGVFKYFLFSYDRRERLINLTEQLIDRTMQSIDFTINLILIKHYNFESKIQRMLPIRDMILPCLALS